uniref:uncharacterized protein LOC124068224 n=1 Tax=Scatophagus argus TaxID=75038 RepID=UPI001ED7F954|nr:uncharacterized protein LOC124068224 [Scatophagus argus]XP_046262208.1 uncharacterized protein LOC124068224 [Scatophagus argus]XP_046262209.1 uncharacterized protein LOC124068224 [Scatophagus argus]
MVMGNIALYVLHGYIFMAAVGLFCVPIQCLRGNVEGETPADSAGLRKNDSSSNCTKDFQVSVNSTGSNVKEGDDITLTCVHNLLNLTVSFKWKKNGKEILEGQNGSKLVLKTVNKQGQYTCCVISLCGTYESSPHDVTVNDHSPLLLVICGVSALVLVVIMGLAMKFKLKRDNAKHRERMRQRTAVGQSGCPAPITPRQS